MTTVKTTITAIAVHRSDASPIFGEGTTSVSLEDDGGAFIVLEQDGQRILLDPEEIPAIAKAAQRLLAQKFEGNNT